jgi:FkbH-like protein
MTTLKCIAWDLDGTVWPEVAIERLDDSLPDPVPDVLATMDLLEARGIVNAVASRSDPALLAALTGHPALADRIVAWRVGWAAKSQSVAEIAEDLGIGVDSIAVVDDSAFERAEITSSLPGVLVVEPAALPGLLDTERFRPAVISDDSRRRPQRYREHITRFGEQAAAAARDDFMRESRIQLDIAIAAADSCDRISELITRSHRLNSTGEQWTPEQVRAIVDDPRWVVVTGTLRDRFGDYGLIASMLIRREASPGDWRLRSLTTSCRASGRSVPSAMLAWAVDHAHAQGVARLLVDVVPRAENLQLRVLLRSAGFVAAEPDAAGTAPSIGFVLARPTTHPVEVPDWLAVRPVDRANA